MERESCGNSKEICEKCGVDDVFCRCKSDVTESKKGEERRSVVQEDELKSVRSEKSEDFSLDERASECSSSKRSATSSTSTLSSIQSFPEYRTESELDIDEILSRLAGDLEKHHTQIIKACKNFDIRNSGKISKTQLRQVIRTFCLPLTAAQFSKLTEHLKEDERGKINYVDFLKSIRDFRCPDPDIDCADEALTTDQLIILMRNKFKKLLGDVVRAFWLFDYNKDGYVKKNEFRKVIQNYCIQLSEEQFTELWIRYGERSTGLLNYSDFLKKIGIHAERILCYLPKFAQEDMPLWEEPCNKLSLQYDNYSDSRRRTILNKNDDPSIAGMGINDIEKFFLGKLKKCEKLLKTTLYLFDRRGDGQINIDDLHHALNCFVMPMSDGLFKDLCYRLKIEATPISNSLSIEKFLDRFCKSDPEQRLQQAKQYLQSSGCEKIIEKINNSVIKPVEKMLQELKQMGKDSSSYVTRSELRKIIESCLGRRMDDKDYATVMTFLDPKHANSFRCSKFLCMFESYSEVETISFTEASDLGLASPSLKERYANLSGSRLISKMKYHIDKNKKSFLNAITACDPNNCKFITPSQLKLILDNFCFPLTDKQFRELKRYAEYQGDRLDYEKFLRIFEKEPAEDSKTWHSAVDKLCKYKTTGPREIPIEEVEEILKDAILAKSKKMLQDFRVLDPCKLGFVYKEDANPVLRKYVMRLTNDQFDQLWKRFPLNKSNYLLYEKLINRYLNAEKSKAMTPDSEPKTSGIHKSVEQKDEKPTSAKSETFQGCTKPSSPESILQNGGTGQSLTAATERRDKKLQGDEALQDAVFSKFPHLRKTCDLIKPKLLKHNVMMRQHLRRLDPRRTGIVNFEDLKKIMAYFGVHLTEEDTYFILEYFDKDLSGRISYKDFMKLFIWYA